MKRRLSVVAVAVVGAAVLAGCGSDGGDTSSPPPSADGDGQALRVVGRSLRFDVERLVAPAETEFTIEFENRDRGVPHNIAVYRSGPPAKDQLAASALEPGPETQRLTVAALEPGRYFFQCDAHPSTMTGTLEVPSGG